MTETEWFTATEPGPLLNHLRPDEGARKTRLLKCACCRSVWHLLPDHRSREGVEAAERFADGLATPGEARRAAAGAALACDKEAFRDRGDIPGPWSALYTAAEAARDTARNSGSIALGIAVWATTAACSAAEGTAHPRWKHGRKAFRDAREQSVTFLAALVRDIFGNPFRPVAFDPRWRTADTVAIAGKMYDARDFAAMPILADALMEAGCEDEQILTHCRSDGPHARGCWVVDGVLGKE